MLLFAGKGRQETEVPPALELYNMKGFKPGELRAKDYVSSNIFVICKLLLVLDVGIMIGSISVGIFVFMLMISILASVVIPIATTNYSGSFGLGRPVMTLVYPCRGASFT